MIIFYIDLCLSYLFILHFIDSIYFEWSYLLLFNSMKRSFSNLFTSRIYNLKHIDLLFIESEFHLHWDFVNHYNRA